MTSALDRSLLGPRWQAGLAEPVIALDVMASGREGHRGVVAGGSEGAVAVVDAEGTTRGGFDLGDALLTLTTSPDGALVAVTGSTRRAVWAIGGDDEPHLTDCGWAASAAWDARSRSLAVGDGRRVRLLDRTGSVSWSSEPLPSTVTHVLWPRGRRRVAASAYQGVTILEPETDRVVDTLRAPGSISGLAAAPNGRWIVGGSQDATLHGWKVADGSDFRMHGFPTTVSRLAFEDGGRWMVCGSAQALTCWDFSGAGPTGRSAVELRGHQAPVTAFAWRPGDRRTLVSGDAEGNVLVWQLAPTTRPGDQLRPAGGLRDTDPVSAIVVGPPDRRAGGAATPIAYVGRRSGRIDALTMS